MKPEKPLANCTVGISISEPEDLALLGFDRLDINRAVVRLSELLLASGARVAFGHDWRPGGVMEAVATMASRYWSIPTPEKGYPLRRVCPIINRVAFPDMPFLEATENGGMQGESPDSLRKLLKGVVDVKQSKQPKDGSRASSLKLLRRELSNLCDVRICLGGKSKGFEGGMPGVLEEALESIRSKKLLLVSSVFGGISQKIVDAIQDNRGDFMLDYPVLPKDRKMLDDWARERVAILSEVEDRRLLYSVSMESCAELILRACVKYWQGRNVV